jgi:poly(hydroxyalkanoate) depolymerase family esterase
MKSPFSTGLLRRALQQASRLGHASGAQSLQRLMAEATTEAGAFAFLGRLPNPGGVVAPLLDGLGLRVPSPARPGDHAPPTEVGGMLAGTYTGSDGARPYRLFVPPRRLAGRIAGRPRLIVMLHGCTQTAEDFATGTGMNRYAGAADCLVLYPEQVSRANPQRCWNWFNPADQQRDHGEPALIAGMTRQVMAQYDVDPAAIFVAGLSAGGALAVIMAEAYPDLFAAVGVHSGLACGAATDMASAFAAMRQGRPGASRAGAAIPAIVFHGDRDSTVNPRNAIEVVAQLAGAASQDAGAGEAGQAQGGLGYTRTVHRGADGTEAMEQWVVHGAGHAWSGGSSAGSYTEPAGPDASAEMLRFFLAHQR